MGQSLPLLEWFATIKAKRFFFVWPSVLLMAAIFTLIQVFCGVATAGAEGKIIISGAAALRAIGFIRLKNNDLIKRLIRWRGKLYFGFRFGNRAYDRFGFRGLDASGIGNHKGSYEQ